MVAGSQARGHEAINDDQVWLGVLDDGHDGGEDVDHLGSRVGDRGRHGVLYGLLGIHEARLPGEGVREVGMSLRAKEMLLKGLGHGDAIDLVIRDALGECILDAIKGGEMQVQGDVGSLEGRSRGEEGVDLATLDVGDHQHLLGNQGSHGGWVGLVSCLLVSDFVFAWVAGWKKGLEKEVGRRKKCLGGGEKCLGEGRSVWQEMGEEETGRREAAPSSGGRPRWSELPLPWLERAGAWQLPQVSLTRASLSIFYYLLLTRIS